MQAWVRGLAFGGSLLAALMLASAAGCGDSNGDGGGGPPPPEATPGELNIEIQGVDLPETGAPVVTFRVTDRAGAPIDLIQEIRNGAANPPVRPSTSPPRFTLAQLEDDGDYVSYYERSITGRPFIPSEGASAVQPASGSETQAVSDNVPTDATLEQRLTAVGDGVYRFQMSAPNRTGLDRSKTHTAAAWATRTLATPNDPGHPANASFNFRPGSGRVSDTFETVTDAACNTCHGQLEAHDRRTGIQLCITCHSPQSTDPETGNTVDMKVMIHRIHMGESLPSVQQGEPYRIVGFAPGNPATLPASAVHDFSQFRFPRAVTDCAACHQGEDANRWNTVANVTACNSCHDNVRFDGSAGRACGPGVLDEPCNHAGGQVNVDTVNCTTCHGPNEITVKHQNPLVAGAGQFRYELIRASVDAERKPVVDFRVVDPTRQNAPYDIKTAAPFTQGGGASTLTVSVAWLPQEFTNEGSGVAYGQPIAMNALTAATPVEGQPGVFRVTTAPPQGGGAAPTVPEGVSAVTVMIEGHPVLNGARIPVTTLTESVALGGGAAPAARRTIVTTEKCNSCHGWLTAHGANRNNNVLACAVCHNANATDERRRPSGVAGEESVDLKVLIHEVHGVGVRENPVTIYGFGNTPHTFPVGLGNVANCNVCHEGTSYMIPIAPEALATTIDTGADPAATADNTRRPPTQAACLSCHDGAVAHAEQYTVNGVETCVNCHGQGESIDVSQVHPVLTRP